MCNCVVKSLRQPIMPFLIFSFLQCLMYVLVQAPLSHRKHCSRNASSVVPPLITWLCDITLCHRVTHLHNQFPAATLAYKNCCKCCWLRRVWAIQSEQIIWYLGGRALKRQELKQSISDRGRIQCCWSEQYEETDVFTCSNEDEH